ncbi:hypothetical protein [Tenacibaculum sp. M341]|uniref:hypothetical protein n=1 Tax=Tenacibaculum sp. M341 TaxID=2530339 RepID=UPI001043AF32|nr:hypothetical protein [Tenacibaculum sp. M341]TCI92594.1 hypothetical protein EYW44_06750 [Tenacibaculum sp. M341]
MKTFNEISEENLIGGGITISTNTSKSIILKALNRNITIFIFNIPEIDFNNNIKLIDKKTIVQLQKLLHLIHRQNRYALISFNRICNNSNSDKQIHKLVVNTIKFCKNYNFDGIDINILPSNTSNSLTRKTYRLIRSLDDSLIISSNLPLDEL